MFIVGSLVTVLLRLNLKCEKSQEEPVSDQPVMEVSPMDIDDADFQQIQEMIKSDSSPVGIDAVKTHIYIIHKLNRIEERLSAIEKALPQAS